MARKCNFKHDDFVMLTSKLVIHRASFFKDIKTNKKFSLKN